MHTYLVTGGAGFIGSTIVRLLLAERPSVRVRVFDNLSTGHLKNLSDLRNQIEFVQGDLRNPQAVAGVVQGVDYLIHQAALVSVPYSVKEPVETDTINTHGTVALLHAAQQAGVRRAVIASSAAVYGNNPALPLDEQATLQPLSAYAASKLATEFYAQVFTHTHGLPVVALRYFNVYGPRQDPNSPYAAAIPIFLNRLRAGRAPTVYGDGQQTRDFVFAEDVARANLCALQDNVPGGEVFNIASGRRISVLDLLDALNQALDSQIKPEFAPARAGEVVHSGASIEKARTMLEWQPSIDLHEGIRRTTNWFRAI